MQQQSPPEQFDLSGMVDDLNSLLRLKTTVIGIKMFAAVEEMTAIPKIRRRTSSRCPSSASTPDATTPDLALRTPCFDDGE